MYTMRPARRAPAARHPAGYPPTVAASALAGGGKAATGDMDEGFYESLLPMATAAKSNA